MSSPQNINTPLFYEWYRNLYNDENVEVTINNDTNVPISSPLDSNIPISSPSNILASSHGGDENLDDSETGSETPSSDSYDNIPNNTEPKSTKQIVKGQLELSTFHDFLQKVLAKQKDARDPQDEKNENSKFPLEWIFPSFYSAVLSFIGPFLVFLLLAGLTQADNNYPSYFNGSFGAAVTLLFSMPYTPPAQPKHVFLGQLISGAVALAWVHVLPSTSTRYITSSLAVASAVFLMKITGTTHPPGGATAYIITSQLDPKHLPAWAGYYYLVLPLLVGNAILCFVAIVLNNIPKKHHYPERWI